MEIVDLFGDVQDELILQEAFSSWKYKIPDDPEKLIYDFYFLSFFLKEADTNDESFNFTATEASHEIVDYLQEHMTDALKFAISCEIHYFSTESSSFTIFSKGLIHKFLLYFKKYRSLTLNPLQPNKEIEKKIYEKERKESRFFYFKVLLATLKRLKISDLQFANIAETIFDEGGWYGGYGGWKWGRIAEAYGNLLKAKSYSQKAIWIDHAYDLQHNNATVFSKLKYYYKSPPKPDLWPQEYKWIGRWSRDDVSGYTWLGRALDWKRDTATIMSFYDKVSSSLKPLVLYASKNLDNKTLEDYLKKT